MPLPVPDAQGAGRRAARHPVSGAAGTHPAWWVLGALILLAAAVALARSPRPLRRALTGAVCGVGALGAVNILAPFTGVAIALNHITAFAAVVLGAPGVITMLLLRLLVG